MPANVFPRTSLPSVMPAAGLTVSVPKVAPSTTVSVGESTSAKMTVLAGQTRLPATSSVTVNWGGADTVGASLTLVTEIVKAFSVERPPRSVLRTRTV